MKIYIVILEDRHIDVKVQPFCVLEDAIEWAKKMAADNWRNQNDYMESTEDLDDGLMFFASYSDEGDSVSVVEVELINP